jgi:hypothetical protein
MKNIMAMFFSFFLLGCSTPNLNFFDSSTTIIQLPLPTLDNGYTHLTTRVITSSKEYKGFLSAIDTQSNWDHKVAFGMTIGKAKINFQQENLLIFRYRSAWKAVPKILSSKDANVTVGIEESSEKIGAVAQAFFYKVSKKIKKITFKSKQRIVIVNNKRNTLAIPKECIAWFDGCNHCIRSATGRAMCTKRYCKKKAAFRCVKWQ